MIRKRTRGGKLVAVCSATINCATIKQATIACNRMCYGILVCPLYCSIYSHCNSGWTKHIILNPYFICTLGSIICGCRVLFFTSGKC